MGLLLVYGLNTWLPEIMRRAGLPARRAALALLLALNVGAVIGLLIGGARRRPDRRAAGDDHLVRVGAVFLALLSIRLPGVGVYVGVLLAGDLRVLRAGAGLRVGRALYPAAVRGDGPRRRRAGSGASARSPVRRSAAPCSPAGLAYPWGFYAFALVAALGAVAAAAVGRTPEAADVEAVPEPDRSRT